MECSSTQSIQNYWSKENSPTEKKIEELKTHPDLPKVRKLNLQGLWSHEGLTEELLTKLIEIYPNVISLDLSRTIIKGEWTASHHVKNGLPFEMYFEDLEERDNPGIHKLEVQFKRLEEITFRYATHRNQDCQNYAEWFAHNFLGEESCLKKLDYRMQHITPETEWSCCVTMYLGTTLIPTPFFTSLVKNKSLTTLNLSDCEMTKEASQSFQKTLSLNSTLKDLWISNFYDLKSALSLLAKIGNIISLERFNMTRSAIDDDDAVMIAKMLKKNHTILYMSLASNSITDKGAESILQALATRRINLLWLNFAHNSKIEHPDKIREIAKNLTETKVCLNQEDYDKMYPKLGIS